MHQRLKNLQLWLHNHYEGTRFWVAMVTAAVVLFVLISSIKAIEKNAGAIKDQTDAIKAQNEAIESQGDRLIRYQECVAKLSIISPEQTKRIEGDIADPAAALEQCRIEIVDGVTDGPTAQAGPDRRASSAPPQQPPATLPPQGQPQEPADPPPEPNPDPETVQDILDELVEALNCLVSLDLLRCLM